MDGSHGPPDPTQSQILPDFTSRLASRASSAAHVPDALVSDASCPLAGLKTPSVWRFFWPEISVQKCFGNL